MIAMENEFNSCIGIEGKFKALNLYLVSFLVDTSVDHVKSNAVVIASSEEDAINKINRHIGKLSGENDVEKVFFCRQFTGTLFTEKFGWG